MSCRSCCSSPYFSYPTAFGFFFVFYVIYEIVSQLPLGYYIGDIGCITYDLSLNFNVGFVQSQSFFMALYRYLCIVHCEFLDNHNISGKVKYLHP